MNMFAFVVKVIIVLVLVFLIEFYFVKKVVWAIQTLFPKVSGEKIKFWKRLGLVFLNLFPISVIILMAYFYFTNNYEFALPENNFYDYFILYPFWIGTIIIVQSILIFLFIDLIKVIFFSISQNVKQKFQKTEAKLFFIILLLSTIYVPARIVYDYKAVAIRHITFNKPGLPNRLMYYE